MHYCAWTWRLCPLSLPGPGLHLIPGAQALYFPGSRQRALTSCPVLGARTRYRSQGPAPGFRLFPGARAHNCPGSRRRSLISCPNSGSRAHNCSGSWRRALISCPDPGAGPAIAPALGDGPSPFICFPVPIPVIASGARLPGVALLLAPGPTISSAPGGRPSPLVRFPAPGFDIAPSPLRTGLLLPRLPGFALLPAPGLQFPRLPAVGLHLFSGFQRPVPLSLPDHDSRVLHSSRHLGFALLSSPKPTIAPASGGGPSPLIRILAPVPVIDPCPLRPGPLLPRLPALGLHFLSDSRRPGPILIPVPDSQTPPSSRRPGPLLFWRGSSPFGWFPNPLSPPTPGTRIHIYSPHLDPLHALLHAHVSFPLLN
ncbi:unnamed protein product [Linum trigynum]|uniref:SRCR domain-containing protein n=1 Tax=Linum trigynum TaxID=586398 RepID=A0AAV2CGD8_9ROSI